MTSHLLADMEDVCDRVAIICDGRLRAEGRVADLLKQTGSNLESFFLGVVAEADAAAGGGEVRAASIAPFLAHAQA
jgi:ABC-type multidrug transport system ATPase subunit